MKKRSAGRPIRQSAELTWHNGGDLEMFLYARSLRTAGQVLIANLAKEPSLATAWEACPVINLYRQAVELHLKSLVGEGSKFLSSPTDPISLFKTHSLRWLAQIVCQIIKQVKWEAEFECDGMPDLAAFTALIAELEALDPVASATDPANHRAGDVPEALRSANVVEICTKLDGLLDLLAATADGLAATWDLMEIERGERPTIH